MKSSIWVKAYVRRCAVAGASAYVVRHGDDDAGAIFLRINRLDGTSQVFGPAPAGLADLDGDRQWTVAGLKPELSDTEADALLRRETEFDSDLWIVEVEDRKGRNFLDDYLKSDSD
ncbi:MAG: DUF1491 family protein [Burkholderiales bacterium]